MPQTPEISAVLTLDPSSFHDPLACPDVILDHTLNPASLPSDHPRAFAVLLMNEHHQSSIPPPGTLGLLAWTRAEPLSRRAENLQAPPSELLNILLQSLRGCSYVMFLLGTVSCIIISWDKLVCFKAGCIYSVLIGKDTDAGKDWRQKKRATEDEIAGWHHWFTGHEPWANSGRWWETQKPGML